MSEPLVAVAARRPRSTKTLPKRPRLKDATKCLLQMCTHALPHLSLALPLRSDAIQLKLALPANSHVCTPYRYVPQVPQEIIDIIIDNIEDMASFKACSLVCWAFVPASRTHIFRTICLNMLNDQPKHLFEVLSRNPHLEVYIRDLTIYRSCDTHLWMKTGSPLPALLSRLNHVERFSVFGCWGYWKDVPHSFQSALTRLVSLRTLDRLHILATKDISPSFLSSALSVRVLSLFHVSVDMRQNVKRSLRLPHVRENGCSSPEYLNLSLDSHVGVILDHMRGDRTNYFAAVRRLAINPIPNSVSSGTNLAKVLAEVETTLERLDVQLHETHYELFDTSRLTKLREFQIHVIKEDSTFNTIPELLPDLVARLRAAHPLLERLTIVIHLHARAVDAGLDFPCVHRLRAIDETLSGEGGIGFAQLKDVLVRVVSEASPPTLVLNYPGFIRDHLPRTWSRGVLRVEETTRARGDAIMPLLPYTSVWPHRSRKNQPAADAR